MDPGEKDSARPASGTSDPALGGESGVDRGGPTPPAVDRPNASPPATDVRVSVDEPPLPRRTRRPYDTPRLFVLLVAVVGRIALAIVAERTLTGLTSDVAALSTQLPDGPIDVLSFVSSLVGLLVPPALVVMLMLRGRLRMTAEVLAAGVVAAVAAALVSQLLEEPLATRVESVFVPVAQDASTAIPAYPALLVAIVTVVSRLNVSRLNMRRLRQATLFAIVGSFAVGLLGGFATVGGTLVSIARSEEHTSELQSRGHLVCRLLLEKKNIRQLQIIATVMIGYYL